MCVHVCVLICVVGSTFEHSSGGGASGCLVDQRTQAPITTHILCVGLCVCVSVFVCVYMMKFVCLHVCVVYVCAMCAYATMTMPTFLLCCLYDQLRVYMAIY